MNAASVATVMPVTPAYWAEACVHLTLWLAHTCN